MITKLIKAETCQHQQDLSACNNNAYCRKKHILCLPSVFHVSLCTTHLAALVIRGISAGRADYIIHKYTALHRSRSCFYNLSYIVGLFWKHTLSRLFKKPLTAALLPPVLQRMATVWCGWSVWVVRYAEMWEVRQPGSGSVGNLQMF